MHIKFGMALNLDDIINIFAGQHQRRMLFVDNNLCMLFLC